MAFVPLKYSFRWEKIIHLRYKRELKATFFDIESNFIKINSTKYTFNDYCIIDIISSISNKNNILICNNIYENNSYKYKNTYCFLYDIQNNIFVVKYFYKDNYNDKCNSIDMLFFKEINEFNLILKILIFIGNAIMKLDF